MSVRIADFEKCALLGTFMTTIHLLQMPFFRRWRFSELRAASRDVPGYDQAGRWTGPGLWPHPGALRDLGARKLHRQDRYGVHVGHKLYIKPIEHFDIVAFVL